MEMIKESEISVKEKLLGLGTKKMIEPMDLGDLWHCLLGGGNCWPLRVNVGQQVVRSRILSKI